MIVRLTSCVLCTTVMIFTGHLRAEQNSNGSVDAAREQFSQGVELVDQGRYQEALVLFRELERARPHSVLLYNIAWCLSELGRHADAIDAFDAYLEEGDDESGDRVAQARGELERLRVLVGAEHDAGSPRADPGEETSQSDGVGDSPGRGRLAPGWFWGSLGLTLATAAAMTGTGAAALSLSSRWQESWELEDRDRGETLISVTNGLLIAVACEAIVTLVLGIFTDFGRGRLSDTPEPAGP